MIVMFILWLVVLVCMVRRPSWVPGLAVVTLVLTAVLLKLHMTDPIPLNF